MVSGGTISAEQQGEPWFADGNIVLFTQDTDAHSGVAFKLHRGVLARHSEIFESMFEMPPPMGEEVEMAEECQVVRMHDLPDELSALVRALYDGPSFRHASIEDFYYVAGILRLSTKYLIAHLRRQAIVHLLNTWPHTLQGHDRFVERAVKAPLVGDLTYPYVHPLHVVNLARETHINIVLPAAFYFLSLYELPDILAADHPKLRVKHPSRPSNELSPPDLEAYTLMYQHRLKVIQDFIRVSCTQRAPAPTCVGQYGLCQKGFIRLGTRLERSWQLRTGPLHYMVQVISALADDPNVCAQCRRAFKTDIMALREKTWTELPGIVGLPSWKQMEKADMED